MLFGQRIAAVMSLTWKAAFRFKLFLVIAALLLVSVIGLPILIEDDGTARGFTQILLTYTLSVISALLGLSTLWLACGTLARDIEECQIQVVTTKPIARWQVWVGKWIGIVTLNAALLAISGACVYALLQWRSTRLSPQEQMTLRNEVLVARGSVRPPSVAKEIEAETDAQLRATLSRTKVAPEDILELRKQIKERFKAGFQIVPPRAARRWQLDLGMAHHFLQGQPLFLRIKFNTPNMSPSGTFAALWQVGVPNKTQVWANDVPMSFSPDTFHEFEIPPDLFDETGMLTVVFINLNETALLFPMEDCMEVLYRESGFGVNFIRGLGVILCWMALLAALGLAAASYFSFPVAAFVSLSVLVLSFSSGTLANAVAEGKITNYNAEHGPSPPTVIDHVVIPVFRSVLTVINLAKDFSPVDSLSTGRSITWWQLGQAFSQIVLLLSGVIALIGIVGLNRRELATAQGNQ